jgi:cytochrome P450
VTSEPTTAPDTDPIPGSYLPPMLNPFAEGFFDNPYEQYAALRASDPVHRTPMGPWMLSRHHDVVRVLRDPKLSVEARNSTMPEFADPEMVAIMESRRERGSRAILNIDPPDHHRIRRLVSKVFTPKVIEGLRPQMQRLVDAHLDEVVSRGDATMDVIADLAFPLPFAVISDMMGIEEGRDRNDLRAWSHALVKTFDPILSIDDVRAAAAAGDNFLVYMTETIAAKRTAPDDKLLSAMIAAEEDGDRLSEQELIDNVILLFVAGHETTVNLIGNGTLALLRHPDQLERLRTEPELGANAVDELLRYDSPVQFSGRFALAPFEIGGHSIGAGSPIMVCLGAANRDPETFPDPDRLDIARPNANQHCSFGGGVHHCLGNALARLEAEVAIGTLVRRFPSMHLASDRLDWNGRIVLRGLNALPVAI